MDTGMLFEGTARLFFGERAYQIAGQASSPIARRKWLKKILRLLLKRMNELETTVRHKEMLMKTAEAAERELGRNDQPTWTLVYHLITLVGRLLGYDFVHGARCHSLVYFQERGQYYTTDILSSGDALQEYYDEKDAVSVRQEVVKNLKIQGLSDFKISLVLNATEYQVKKLRGIV